MRRPHPSYRQSGEKWLGQVPEHWEVAQARRWFSIVNGGTPASGDESYWDGETVWLTPDDLGRNSAVWISESRRRLTDQGVRSSSARVSPEGSIILSTRARIGHIAITAVPAATNQGCRTLVPNPGDSSFAYYSLIASRAIIASGSSARAQRSWSRPRPNLVASEWLILRSMSNKASQSSLTLRQPRSTRLSRRSVCCLSGLLSIGQR